MTVYISATLEEALDGIMREMRLLLEEDYEVTLDVRTGAQNMKHLNLDRYRLGAGVRVFRQEAPVGSALASMPRAEVTLYGTTWAGQDDNGDFLSWRDVHQLWEISACPTGMDPRVHEVAETLLWDAQEQGQVLSVDDAVTLAKALFAHDSLSISQDLS